jgi:hypothetical protein
MAWNNFTISNVKSSEIGTKFLNKFGLSIKYNNILHKTEDPDTDTAKQQKCDAAARLLIAIYSFRENVPSIINSLFLHHSKDDGA